MYRSFTRHALSTVYRRSPTVVQRNIDILRSYHQCIYDRKKPVFIHIPKNAGTSMAMQLYGKRILHLKASEVKNFFDRNISTPKRYFAILRDPLRRFISAANFLASGGTKTVPLERMVYYKDYDLSDLESYVEILSAVPEYQLDPVLRRQSYYADIDIQLVTIDQLNSLSPGSNEFVNLKRTNVSKKIFKHEDLSAKAKVFLCDYYRKDFELYGKVVEDIEKRC